MSAVFLELFNRAVSAGWLLLALLILRPVLKKLPAWVRCLLWCCGWDWESWGPLPVRGSFSW